MDKKRVAKSIGIAAGLMAALALFIGVLALLMIYIPQVLLIGMCVLLALVPLAMIATCVYDVIPPSKDYIEEE
jgi:hypothetical protein